jgi:ParB-like nuclease family protein
LDALVSDVSMPIKDIVNANPAWVRDDFGDMEQLTLSIRLRGIQLPVLVTPDKLMIDGARRLFSARELGATTIPVKVAHSWGQVVEYFIQARRMEAEGLVHKPLRVLEFGALVNGPLYRLLKHDSSQRATTTRRLRRMGKTVPAADNHKPNEVFAEMFNLKVSEVIVRRDIYCKVNVCKSTGLGDAAVQLVNDVEDKGGRLFSLQGALSDLMEGRSQARRRFFPGQRTVAVPVPHVDRTANPGVAKEQAGKIKALIFQLGLIGDEIRTLGPLNHGMSPETADELQKLYRAALRKVTPLRLQLLEMGTREMETTE